MTGGGSFLPSRGEEYNLGGGAGINGGHAVQWIGTPSVKGPKWAKLPLLTIGMLGIQVCSDAPSQGSEYQDPLSVSVETDA